MKTKLNKLHASLIWQLPLTVVFLCFGLLVMAQYYTHLDEVNSLQGESTANLALIMQSVTDNKHALETELLTLEDELLQLEEAIAGGDNLSNTLHNRITNFETVLGLKDVNGEGLTLSLSNESNLIFQDIIDIVNELMNSGAEAVSVNDIRVTIYTQIGEEPRLKEKTDPTTGKTSKEEIYVVTIDGKELLAPIQIKAIGDTAVMETALTYPGGIISNLSALYGVQPTIRAAANLVIPAATRPEFVYASTPETAQ